MFAPTHFLGTQCDLAPLFEQLHNKSIEDDILASLTIIVRHLLDQNYVAADKAYYQMTRGKSPHQIFSKDVPYNLTQWKYFEGLEQLMIKCEMSSFFYSSRQSASSADEYSRQYYYSKYSENIPWL